MDLNALKMFILTAQAGSFSAGSQKSAVPIATLSRKIRELETSLKMQLFERSAAGVKLTLQGQKLYEQSYLSIETLDDMERNLNADQQHFHGSLRLSMPAVFEDGWRLLDDFHRHYPHIRLQILAGEQKLDLLQENIDVALRIGNLNVDTLIARKVGDIRLILAASPAFIEQYGTPKAPAELLNFPTAAWANRFKPRFTWQLNDKAYDINPQFISNEYAYLRHLLLQGKALGELPLMLATPLIKTGKLVEVLPEYRFAVQPLHLLYPSHCHPSNILRAYIDFCRQWLTENEKNQGSKK